MLWFFERDVESLTYEVRRSGPEFELVVHHPDSTCTVQTVPSASELLREIGVTPRALLADGWRPVAPSQRRGHVDGQSQGQAFGDLP